MANNGRATLTSGKASASARWLKNAMKSVGLAAKLEFSSIAPNLTETSSAVISGASSLASSITRGSGDTSSIVSNIKNNKYVQIANNTINQAIKDIKSGNLVKEPGLEDDSTEYSIGEEGSETIEIKNDNSSIKQLSESIDNQTESQLKAQKATMDAYIAVNTVNMQQSNRLGTDIINQLSNINNNLAAIVQFNNDNMNKFIEASVSYYDQVGKGSGSSTEIDDRKIAASDLVSAKGGINLNTYKDYIKQQFKKTLNNTEIGQLGAIFSDDMFLESLQRNPIGTASSLFTSYMVPVTLKATLQGVEKTFSNIMPTMLAKLGDWGNIQGTDLASKIMKFVGNTFGIKNDVGDNISNHKLERGPIPFDGETKTAITEVITKELRDQTAYLEIIANNFSDGNAREKSKSLKRYFNYGNGEWETKDEINNNIANELQSSILDIFTDSSFGKNLKANVVDSRSTDAEKKIMQDALNEFFINISRHNGSIDTESLGNIISGTKQADDVKEKLKDALNEMREKDGLAFGEVNNLAIQSSGSYKRLKDEMRKDNIGYNINNSMFNGSSKKKDEYGNMVERSTEDIMDEVLGINQYRKDPEHKKILKSGKKGTTRKGYVTIEGMSQKLGAFGEGSSKIMKNLVSGDAVGAITEGGKLIADALAPIGKKASKFLFGEKGEDGNRSGGVLSDLSNFGSDVFKQMKYKLLGTGYTLSDGTKVEDDPNSIAAQFKNSVSNLKDTISTKIFGEKDADGNRINKEDSILGKVKSTFLNGFSFWTDAFFGIDDIEDPAEREKARKEYLDNTIKSIKDNMPNAALGAVGGLVFSKMAGGILGSIVGLPMIGATIGATTGFLAKNEKFQNYLFGEKDPETNERKGGLISKGVQDWFKNNKDAAILGIGAGTILGSMGFLPPGSGLLTKLVGGPITGSLLGLAGTVALKGGMFQKFLFGDEESGQRGLIGGINHAIQKNFGGKNGENGSAAGALFGAGAGALIGKLTIGSGSLIGAGGILGAITSGPVVGSLLGLAMSIKASEGGFREWLFGKKDGFDLGDGTKTKKQGVLGKLGNTIDVNIIKPMKTSLSWIGKDFMNVLEHKILMPFAITSEFFVDKTSKLFKGVANGIKGLFSTATKNGKSMLGKIFSPVTNAVGKMMTKTTELFYKTTTKIISAPGNMLMAVIRGLDLKDKFKNFLPVKIVRGFFKDIRRLVFRGIKAGIKGLFNIIAAPFKAVGFIGKWFGRGIKSATKSLFGAIKNSKAAGFLKDKFQNGAGVIGKIRDGIGNVRAEYRRLNGEDAVGIGDLIKRNSKEYKERKKELKKQKEANKAHDKNAKLIAKATKGQFRDDSDEARKWLQFNNPALLRKVIDNSKYSIDEEYNQEKAKRDAEINGEGTKGLSNVELDRKDPSKLTEQGRTNWFLSRIFGGVEKLTSKVVNGDDDRYISPEEQAEIEAREEEERKKNKDKENEGKNDEESDTNTSGYDRELYEWDNSKGFFGNFKAMMADYAKSDRLKEEAREIEKEKEKKNFIDSLETPENFKLIGKRWSNLKQSIKNARNKNNTDAENSEMTENAADAGLEAHADGGILEEGLSLVGEKGAELIKKDKDDVEVIDHDESSKLLKSGKAKKINEEVKEEDEKAKIESLVNKKLDEERDKKEEENRKAKIESVRSNADQNKMEALDRATTAAEKKEQVKKEKEAEEEKKERRSWMHSMKEGVKNTASGIGGLFSSFTKVFDLKKGVVTLLALTGLTWLKNNLPGVFETLLGALNKIAGVLGDFLGKTLKDILTKTFNDDYRTDNNSITEEAARIADETANGNIFQMNDDGSVSNRTSSVVNFIKNKVINFKYRNKKGVLDRFMLGAKKNKKKNRYIKRGQKAAQRAIKNMEGEAQTLKSKRLLKDKKINVKFKDGTYYMTATDAAKNPKLVDELTDQGFKVNTVEDDLLTRGKNKVKDVVTNGVDKFKNSKAGGAIIDAADTAKNKVKDVGTTIATKTKDFAVDTMDKVKGTKAGKAVTEVASNAANKVKNAKNVIKDVAVETLDKAKNSDGLIGKLMKHVEDFFNFIMKGVKKKFGNKAGKGILEKFGPKAIKAGLEKVWSSATEKLAKTALGKIGAVVAKGVTMAATTLGIGNLINLGLGAVEGLTGTAKLFGVSSDQVDGTMKVISTIFGAIEGTTLGGIASILNELIYSIMNVNLFRNLASAIYNAVSSKEDADKLAKSQEDWTKLYEEETDKSMKEQYETQKKAGIIPKDITYDEFLAGVDDGKYTVNHKSEADWNADKNKSMSDHVMSFAGKAWKGAKNFFGGETQYTDKNGNVYTEGEDGMWNVTDKDGNELGQVGKDAIPEDAEKSKKHGIVSGAISAIGGGLKKAGGAIKKAGGAIFGAAKKVGGAIFGFHKKVGGALIDNVKNVGSAIFGGAKGAVDSLKKGDILGAGKSVATAGLKVLTSPLKTAFNFITKKSEKGYYAEDGSYYMAKGEGYEHYSANGDLIDEKCDPDTITQMIQSGALKEGTVQVNNAVGNVVQGMKEKVSNLWNSAKEKGTKLLDKITGGGFSKLADKVEKAGGIGGLISGSFKTTKKEGWFDQHGSYYILDKNKETYTRYSPNGDIIKEKIPKEEVEQMIDSGILTKGEVKVDGEAKKALKKIGGKLKDMWSAAKKNASKVLESITGALSSGVDAVKNFIGIGGSGDGIPLPSGGKGGFGTYYSQNDPKWRESSYNIGEDDATMGDAGCGPTAMAMAISDATGKQVDPMTMANVAKMTGNRDQTGTNWNFVNNASNAYGVSTTQILNPTSRDIVSELRSGNPVVLSGSSDSASVPYTKAGHYIVARGIDDNGNVIVDDPRGKSYSKGYNLEKLAEATGSSWIIGGHGMNSTSGAVSIDEQLAVINATNSNQSSIAKLTRKKKAQEALENSKSNIAKKTTEQIESKKNPYLYESHESASPNQGILRTDLPTYTKEENKNGTIYESWTGSDARQLSGNDSCVRYMIVTEKKKKKTVRTTYMFDDKGNILNKLTEEQKTRNVTKEEAFDITRWIAVVKEVKQKMANKQIGYSQTNSTDITIGDKTIKMRTDCSGFVSTCLKFYGVLDEKTTLDSSAFADVNNSAMKGTGFISKGWPGWDYLNEGDIIAENGHVEIFAYNKDGKHYVYNVGWHTSANTPGATESKKKGDEKYTVVWMPSAAGEGCIMADGSGATVQNGQRMSILDRIKNVFSAIGTGMQDAMFGKSVDFKSLAQQAIAETNADGTVISSGDASTSSDGVTSNAAAYEGIKYAASESQAKDYPKAVKAGDKIPSVSKEDIHVTDIKKLPGLDEASIEKIIKKRLANQDSVVKVSDAGAIKQAQDDSGISALALMGIATKESGLGTSNIAKKKYNLWGWNATNDNPMGNAKQWSSVADAFSQYTYAFNNLYYAKRGEHSLLDVSGHGCKPNKGYAFTNGKPSYEWGTDTARIISDYINYGLTASNNVGGSSEASNDETDDSTTEQAFSSTDWRMTKQETNNKKGKKGKKGNKKGNKKGGGGFGSGLSSRNTYRVNKATNKVDMRNATISRNKLSLLSNAIPNNSISSHEYISNDNTTNELLIKAIEILSAIAGNTLDSSNKLSALDGLKNLQNNISVNNSTPVVIPATSNSVPSSNGKPSRKDLTANAIAKGGY